MSRLRGVHLKFSLVDIHASQGETEICDAPSLKIRADVYICDVGIINPQYGV